MLDSTDSVSVPADTISVLVNGNPVRSSTEGGSFSFDYQPQESDQISIKVLDTIKMLDVSISFSLPEAENRSFESTMGLSVISGYNQTNLTDQVVRAAGVLPDFARRNAMKFAPNLMVMLEF